ncbi:MAG: flagellar motor protein MotB [Myxococcaceae bacterium]|nr:flagellar motor protein MotB [Myxococcaceae bacterium]
MARKHKHEEHENHERWLVSYADFITLLFAFFVVMYSVSRVDNKRVQQAAQSIKWAMHFSGTGGVGELPIFEGPASQGGCPANLGNGGAAGQGGQGASVAAQAKVEGVKRRLEKKLKPYLQDKRLNQTVLIEAANGRLTVRLAAQRFFDPAQAALRPEALPVLDAIGEELEELRRPIRVEAHTDDTTFAGGRYRNNWDLSAARASTVTALLEEGHHIKPQLLTAAGLASARPLVPNDTPEHREANRRVEMVVDLYSTDVSATVAH